MAGRPGAPRLPPPRIHDDGHDHRDEQDRCGEDQGLDRGVDARATAGRPAGELGPVLADAPPLPPHYGVWSTINEGRPPASSDPGQPDPGQPDPPEAIRPAQPRPRDGSLVHGELVAQGKVLQSQLPVAAAEETGRVGAGGAAW